MIDSHFHSLEMAAKGLDPQLLLAWSFDNGLSAAVDVSVTPENLTKRMEMTARFPAVRFTAGYYPSEAGKFVSSTAESVRMLGVLDSALLAPRVVAVGEIGLDGYRDYAPIEAQIELFRAQLASAAAHRLPVVIHNRECDLLVLESVKEAGLPRGGIMHCYSSDYDTAKRFVDLGFLISFAGNLTYKGAGALQEAARRLPRESLLLETDSPYLAPVPARGVPNHPGYIGHTYTFLASVRQVPLDELALQIASNFARLFGLPEPVR